MDTKTKTIIELVCSLNAGDSGYINDRVYYAIEQYEQLVKKGIIVEENKDA